MLGWGGGKHGYVLLWTFDSIPSKVKTFLEKLLPPYCTIVGLTHVTFLL